MGKVTKEVVVGNSFKDVMTIDSIESLKELVSENLGDDTLSAQDLVIIKVPSGGATTWEIPVGPDDVEKSEDIVGVVLHVKSTRNYWEEDFDDSDGGTPPDCISVDGLTGIGSPSGDCETCGFNQFGSGKNGGKKCQEKKLFFLLQPGNFLPTIVRAPAGSLKNSKGYVIELLNKRKALSKVWTSFTLMKDKSKGGKEFSKIVFREAGDVEADDMLLVDLYKKAVMPVFDTVSVEMTLDGMGASGPVGTGDSNDADASASAAASYDPSADCDSDAPIDIDNSEEVDDGDIPA
jgi:hypothetical protein